MKKLLFFISITSLVFCNLVADTPLPADTREAYIQLSSVTTQNPPPFKSALITWDAIEQIKNFEVSNDKTHVICKVSGLYLVCASMQPGTTSRGVSGYLDSWFEINDIAVPASNSRQSVTQIAPVVLMTNTFLVQLNENDAFSTRILASAPEIGIIYLPNQKPEPSITSFIFSLMKIY